MRALARAENGKTATRSNMKTERSGAFTPMRTYSSDDGRLCRDFRATVAFDEGIQTGIGKACRNADGRWKSEGAMRG